jgi:cobalt-zinc-cadmium resistance protein CzcA
VLDAIITWSLKHRVAVVALWIAVAGLGVAALARLPIDAFPDTTPIQVQINTVAPSLSPLEIERQVTAPIEQAIGGLPGLLEVRSISKFGLSQLTVTFEDGIGVYLARQVVGERLAGVELPASIDRPALGPVATGLGEVFHYLVTGSATLAELRTAQDWIVRPQLRSVSGVAEVNSWGGDERQIQVVVDPVRLQGYGLSLPKLIEVLEQGNASVGGGAIDSAGESSLVQGTGLVTIPADLERTVVSAHDGVPVLLSDVARVVEGREIRRGAVTADGKGEAVLGLGFMLMGENSHDVTHRLSARLAEIRKTLPRGIEVTPVYERTALVDRVLHTVRTNLFEGALLVIAVLFVFLGNLRAGLLVASAIPLSLLFAFDLMTRFGIAGSLMSLGAIDFGLVVDSSVIVVENTVRRLDLESGQRPVIDIVRDAALEVRRPTLFGELIIIIVYLPILTLEGIEGKLFRPMALTVVFALLGSLVMSLTLTPVLASLALRRGPRHRETAVMRGLSRLYRPVLQLALTRRREVLVGAAVIVALAGALATRLGSEFVPRLNEETIVINTVRMAGVAVDESVRYGTRIERALLAEFPQEIERVWTRTGSAEIATDPMGLEVSDVFVTLKPHAQWSQSRTQADLVARMQEALSGLPGMRMIFTQPIEMRVNEMIAGIRTDVGVKIFGDDLELLRMKAGEIEAVVRRIRGAADVTIEQVTGQPLIHIDVDREAAARHGVSAADILKVVEALGGIDVGELREGDRRFPIVVRLEDRYRVDEETLGEVLVVTAAGERIPLSSLTKLVVSKGPSTVSREWGKRRIVVQSNVRGRDVGSFVAEARAAIARDVALPSGCWIRFGGQFEHLERARSRLLFVVPLALASILVLLYLTYGRVTDTVRVFTGVPFAAVGGVIALWLRDIPFSISAGVGFVALSGVAVLGDMVLVSTIRQLLAEGMDRRTAVVTAALRRLRPVLMTGLVASLGFLPMALNTGIGAEVQRPLATVVIGGVVSSTILTLVVLPVLYEVFGGKLEAPNPR